MTEDGVEPLADTSMLKLVFESGDSKVRVLRKVKT